MGKNDIEIRISFKVERKNSKIHLLQQSITDPLNDSSCKLVIFILKWFY
jgi:hypothetical protein